jgi:hypothetical protein
VTLTQCGTRWRALLALCRQRFAKSIADHPNAKEEVDLVRASRVQNSPKADGNGAKWKELADRAEGNMRTVCKFLDGQALFTGLFHMYAATYKEIKDGLHPHSIESGQEDVSQTDQNKRERETETLKMGAAPRNRRGHLQLAKTHGRWQRMTSLRHAKCGDGQRKKLR